jgi:hypothetical protein
MTNHEKFSPVYGFEQGVVIEIVDAYSPTETTYLGYFSHVEDDELWAYTLNSPPDESFEIATDSIKSIIIRSGPWSVWQFAPPEVVGVAYDPADLVPLRFYELSIEFKHDRLRLINSETPYIWMARPWWAST